MMDHKGIIALQTPTASLSQKLSSGFEPEIVVYETTVLPAKLTKQNEPYLAGYHRCPLGLRVDAGPLRSAHIPAVQV